MYDLYNYGAMIADTVRTDAYVQALRQAVKPGSVVLDIGTGTGIWALLSCRFGARKVYAIEADDVIAVARETAALNGFQDRIDFIQDLSTRVTLPEPADVLVSDLHGVLPAHESSLASLADARRRLLAPRGVMIPLRETLWAAVVEAPKLYEAYIAPWEDTRGFQMKNIRQRATNIWRKAPFKAENLATEPQCWAVLDYGQLEDHNVAGTVTWTVARAGAGHGMAIWFDSTLAEGIAFSNAPGMPETIYGQAFFPWPEEVLLQTGDTLSVKLRASFVGNDYIWSWESSVRGQGGSKAHFRQSTLGGFTVTPSQLRKRAADYRPALTETGEVGSFILTRMDGQNSVEQIAAEVLGRFPGRFQNFEEVRSLVGDLSARWSS